MDLSTLLQFFPEPLRNLITAPAISDLMVNADGGVTGAQLVAAALRHRPDRIVIGEARQPEAAYQLLQAMNTGHSGTLSTIHADSGVDALYRLSDLVLPAHSNLSTEFVRAQVARTIHYVVHVERDGDGKRRVRELVRVVGARVAEFDFERL